MIEFKPQMKYFLTANQLPEVPSSDDGTWRRLRVIDFVSKFNENPTKPNEFKIDTSLKQKIENWAQTFASYLIYLYLNVYKKQTNFTEPSEVKAATNQYKRENDYLTEYLMEKVTVTNDPNDIIGFETLWEDFKIWYRTGYDSKIILKRPEFLKYVSKQFGEPSILGFSNVIFRLKGRETIKNDLDV
jgi:phage/plasmid-associated DNA primase